MIADIAPVRTALPPIDKNNSCPADYVHVENPFRMASQFDLNRCEQIAQNIAVNNPNSHVYNLGDLSTLREDLVNVCPELSPETVCTVMLSDTVNFNGTLKIKGLPPGFVFDFDQMAQEMVNQNRLTYTETQIHDLALQLSLSSGGTRLLVARINQEGHYTSGKGEDAELTLPIVNGNVVLNNPYDIGGQLGINVYLLEEVLNGSRQLESPEEYNKYLAQVEAAQQRAEIWNIARWPVGVLALALVYMVGVKITTKQQESKAAHSHEKRVTGFVPGSVGDQIVKEVLEQLGGFTYVNPYWVKQKLKEVEIQEWQRGMQVRVIAGQIITEHHLVKNKPRK